MIELYLVMSMWHSKMRDYTFVHGVFDEMEEAENVQADVINDMSFIEREGYELCETEGLSTQIVTLPYCQRVDEYIPLNDDV